MNHKFKIGTVEPTRCESCGYNEIDHTDRATCETCGNSGTCDLVIPGMLQCESCIEADKKVDEERKGLLQGAMLIDAKQKLEISKQYDQTIKVSPDLFNAKMLSIQEIKAVIDADDSIGSQVAKNDLLAETLETRYKHLSDCLFNIGEQAKEYHAEQRAILISWNELSKKVSDEARARIKMQDVTYVPAEVKTKIPKSPAIKAISMASLKKAASESGFSMVDIKSTCVSRNLQPDEAVKYIMAEMLKKLG